MDPDQVRVLGAILTRREAASENQLSAFLSDPEARRAIKAASLRQSFGRFVREAWRHATGFDYVHGKHIDILVTHLEAVAAGKVSRLLVNIPLAIALLHGELFILEGAWNAPFIAEMESALGAFVDQLDAASLAYQSLVESVGTGATCAADRSFLPREIGAMPNRWLQ